VRSFSWRACDQRIREPAWAFRSNFCTHSARTLGYESGVDRLWAYHGRRQPRHYLGRSVSLLPDDQVACGCSASGPRLGGTFRTGPADRSDSPVRRPIERTGTGGALSRLFSQVRGACVTEP